MASSAGHSSSIPADSDFGANDWLIEEMRERFEADPGSVDPAWSTFFLTGPSAPRSPDRPEEQAQSSPAQPAPSRPAQTPPAAATPP
ncbi:MAG: hypothetical protein L0K74_11255, partial [Acidipropionibacterium acidipropionici]|nr:hypothetical protein [Acidipropionibacterium acidipropionici]